MEGLFPSIPFHVSIDMEGLEDGKREFEADFSKFLHKGEQMPWSKESRQSRGYGAQWEKIRKVVVARDKGLCQPCLREDRVTMYQAVDHIVPKAEAAKRGWNQAQVDDPSNLQCICGPCHKAKTIRETGKSYTPKAQIGLNGWPVGE